MGNQNNANDTMTNQNRRKDAINCDYLLKYIIIGDASVDKTGILRFIYKQFETENEITIVPEFGLKNIEIRNKIYRIQIWDTTGQENFRSITRIYYKNFACAIIVYDITNRKSFNNIMNYIEDCKNYAPKTISMTLVGNFCDLNYKRQVSILEGQKLADKLGIQFYEVSTKTGENIDEMLYNSVNEIARKIDEGYYDLNNDSCGIRKR